MYIDKNTRVLIQGITGRQGSYHTQKMLDSGVAVVAGTTPGKGGQEVCGVPVFDRVFQALDQHPADASMIIVPPPFVLSAAEEAIEAGIKLLVIITEHVPVHDVMRLKAMASKKGVTFIGPNTIGIIAPGQSKVGIMPTFLYGQGGKVAIISRSGTMCHENASNLVNRGVGIGAVISIGGDPIIGVDFVEALEHFRHDDSIGAILLIGEIGQSREEKTAEHLLEHPYPKPVFAFIAGRYAPKGKKMGHAGAIIEKGMGSAKGKIDSLRRVGVKVAMSTQQVADELSRWQEESQQ
ncbi:succinate--CoA ligase subunit alpha [Desulfoferula mesophila]|uniref:Succinyl-CoA synthetase subunit alpha n=1 Tax=Desulfoferula mesophila TaxID=3058419 RepID=A0AAU9EF20_9BACT|nr:succinyl-CoA synthetase subunit alpha [Desulfoferula mesophilus]